MKTGNEEWRSIYFRELYEEEEKKHSEHLIPIEYYSLQWIDLESKLSI